MVMLSESSPLSSFELAFGFCLFEGVVTEGAALRFWPCVLLGASLDVDTPFSSRVVWLLVVAGMLDPCVRVLLIES